MTCSWERYLLRRPQEQVGGEKGPESPPADGDESPAEEEPQAIEEEKDEPNSLFGDWEHKEVGEPDSVAASTTGGFSGN